jgi:hypothetical protein
MPPVSGKTGPERIPDQLTFFTLPERMQRVHTCMRMCDPCGPTALMDCKFGFDTFLVLLLAWLTLFPLSLAFPQILHVPATVISSMKQ